MQLAKLDQGKSKLQDFGIKQGSEIAVIHYSVYNGMSPQEKTFKLRQIYTKLG